MKKSLALSERSESNGFTLIELLVVITIMTIFFGVGLARHNSNTEQVKLRNEAKKLVDVLELAKKKATSGDLSKLTCNGVFQGYEVDIQTNRYFLNLRCTLAPDPQLIATYNFPSTNITIQSGSGLFRFKKLALGFEYRVSELSPTSNTAVIQLKNSSMSECVTISISTTGIVELDEDLISC